MTDQPTTPIAPQQPQEAQQQMTQPQPPAQPQPTTPKADDGIAAIIARAGHIDVKLPRLDGQPGESGYAFRIAARSKQDPTEKGNTTYTGGARWSVIVPGNDTPSRSLPDEAADYVAANRQTLAVVTEHVNRAALIGPYKPEKAQKASGTDPQATVDVAALANLTV